MSGGEITVVVVDDSMLMRAMVKKALEAEGDIRVLEAAKDAVEARAAIKTANPDVVTLDIEMPGMNGLDFLQKIMTLRPTPVVMVSSLTQKGTDASLAALSIGAVDVAAKPAGAESAATFGAELRAKVRIASRARVIRREIAPQAAAPAPAAASGGRGAWTAGLIAIGSSTGGVSALSTLLAGIPADAPPIVIAQHMPVGYTARFAARLASQMGRDVAEGRHGEDLRAGMIRIAPGSAHLEIVARGAGFATSLSDGPPVSGHRPSVDVLFASVANAAGRRAVGAILTGMGRDGADGLLKMRRAKAPTFGQGPRSCVVYGMPKAAREAGAVATECELDALPAAIVAAGRRSSSTNAA